MAYNRNAAVEYAKRWAFGRNRAYMDFSQMGGDCTNFISQCLVAGGLRMEYRAPLGWFYTGPNHRSPSFSGVPYLYNYLVRDSKRGIYVPEEDFQVRIEPGDVIQLSFDGTTFGHSLLVVETTPEIKVATHSQDTLGRPLSDYLYKAARGIHIL